MSNFRKFISMSAVAVLAGTNLLAPLSYADAATAWASLELADFKRNPLEFQMPDSDVYLYAVTAPNNYYVEFHGNNSTAGSMSGQKFTYDQEQALTPNAFTRTGYTYSGWNTDANGGGSAYADKQEVENLAETGTVDLYAQWNVNSYNITYDLNDKTGSSSGVHTPTPAATRTYEQLLEVTNPTRTGYTFSGWDISGMDTEEHKIGSGTSHAASVSGTKATSFQHLRATSGTVKFLAQWSAKLTPYTVKHCKEVLTPAGTYTICETENLSGYTDQDVTPAVTGYNGFTAPETQTEKVKADESTEITYNYTRNSYTLTLIAGTGVQTAKGTGTVNTSGVTTTENDSNTGSFKFEEPIEFSYVLKSGYQNATWSGYSGTASSFTMPHEDIVKELNATTIPYTITLKCRGGQAEGCAEPINYTVESDDITLPTPTRGDYSIFLGWTGGVNNEVTSPEKPYTVESGSTENRTYAANWTCVTGYHIVETGSATESCQPDTNVKYLVNHKTQDLNGTSYTIANSGYMYGTSNTQTQVTANTYEGFTLSGNIADYQTNIDREGNTVVDVLYNRDSYNYTITAPAGGVESTAITSSGASGANSEGSRIKYEDTVTLNADMASGYEFDYWEVKDTSNNPVTVTNSGQIDGATFKMPAGAVTITPHLKKTDYTIKYVLHSGTNNVDNPASYNVESEDITLKNPTRDHSVFKGWKGTSGTTEPAVEKIGYVLENGSVGDRTYEAIWGCDTGYHADGDSCVANKYSIKVEYDDDDKSDVTLTGTYDQWTEIPNPTKSGYIFSGWTISGMSNDVTHYVGGSGSTTDGTSASDVMGTGFKNLTTEYPNGEVTFTAVWVADTVEYRVHHMIEGLDVDTYSQTGQVETHTGKSDSPVVFEHLDITLTGFTYSGGNLSGGQTWPNAVKTETTIDRHGTTHIYLYYDRNRHTVVTAHDDGVLSTSGDGTYDFEHAVTVSAQVKSGYHFVQWTGTPAPAPKSGSGS